MWSKGHRVSLRSAVTPARWRPVPSVTPVSTPEPSAGPVPADVEAPPDEEALARAQLFAEGVAEGRRDAEAAMAAERAALARTIDDIAGLRRRVLDAADHDLMQLAVGMARRILHREVQLDPDILLAMARVALGRLGDRPVATAYLHPADLAAIATTGLAPEGLTMAADTALPRGGCRLVAASGEIDLGIDAQMHELSRQLLGERTSVHRPQLH